MIRDIAGEETDAREHLTTAECLALFDRKPELARFINCADSQDYLAVALYQSTRRHTHA